MFRGLSLARKCQLLFGAAVALIIGAALLGPWVRVGDVLDAGELDTCRQLALFAQQTGAADLVRRDEPDGEPITLVRRMDVPAAIEAAESSPFLAAALDAFNDPPGRNPVMERSESLWSGTARLYRLARAERDGAGALTAVTLVERRSTRAAGRLLVDRVYLIGAGMFAGVLAVLVFYLLTTKIILSPVRALRRTAERVREGDLTIRSEIHTGDEFEELADAFNGMLAHIAETQEQLRSSNRSLDLRLTDLAASNVALHESNRLKGEFLANVSHELRNPLNSIIGFAELLQAIAEGDAERDPSPETQARLAKRGRYLDNIVNAGRSLLELINDLLEMARIEAGKVEIRVEPMNIAASCDGLLALIRPQADRKHIRLALDLPGGDGASLPTLHTDPRKFQQIIFNFLTNAVKFTPEGGSVTLRAEALHDADGSLRVRTSVLDTGPGIAEEDQKVIFDKFRQLESAHTRTQPGTGLGLAIARELASLLQGEIQLVSALGGGSMFSLIVPVVIDTRRDTATIRTIDAAENVRQGAD